jgi:hypothetical protein
MLANAILGLHNADVGTGGRGWRDRCHAWWRKVTARAAAAATMMVVMVVVDHALGAFRTLHGSNRIITLFLRAKRKELEKSVSTNH